MTDPNMPTSKSGGELYLRARKLQVLDILTFILSDEKITTSEVAGVLWKKIAEIDEALDE